MGIGWNASGEFISGSDGGIYFTRYVTAIIPLPRSELVPTWSNNHEFTPAMLNGRVMDECHHVYSESEVGDRRDMIGRYCGLQKDQHPKRGSFIGS